MKYGAGKIMDKYLPDRFQGGEQQLLAARGARLPIAGGDDEFAVRFRNGDEIIRLSGRRRTFQLWLDAEKSAELGNQTRVMGANMRAKGVPDDAVGFYRHDTPAQLWCDVFRPRPRHVR